MVAEHPPRKKEAPKMRCRWGSKGETGQPSRGPREPHDKVSGPSGPLLPLTQAWQPLQFGQGPESLTCTPATPALPSPSAPALHESPVLGGRRVRWVVGLGSPRTCFELQGGSGAQWLKRRSSLSCPNWEIPLCCPCPFLGRGSNGLCG